MADETKTPATPEQKARRKAAKLMGFTQWRQVWRAENPEATKDDRKAAWAEVRKSEVRKARKTLKTLEKSGITVAPAQG